MAAAQGSTDSLMTDALTPGAPVDAREAARNNIIREMVETERKYVQDLEIMQVRTLHSLFPPLSDMFCRSEILQRCITKQHYLAGHNTPALPWSQ